MPSDDRIAAVRDALRSPHDAFRAALSATADQIRAFLRQHQTSSQNGRAGLLAAELGSFGAERIDVGRLAGVLQNGAVLDTVAAEAVERALATLGAVRADDAGPDVVDVSAGGDLRAAVAAALAGVGRAFGAVRTFELARAGGRRLDDVLAGLEAFPYQRWSRGERRLAPPLLVTVDGADLRAESLAGFLDGAQKIVLVVRGRCAPAALVRLVTPGTFVLQSGDATGLDRMIAWTGPGVAALVPDGAARFVHDPAGGSQVWDRLTVGFVPEREPRQSLGGLSAAQQADELRFLRQLAERPAAVPAAPAAPAAGEPAAPAPSDPADRLAAWLLAQANLSDLE